MQIVCKFMAAITSIILDQRRQKKDGTYPIKLRLTFNREQRYYKTPYNQSSDEFIKCRDIKARGEFKLTGLKLNAIEQKANKIIEDLGDNFTFSSFEKLFLQNRALHDSLGAAFADYINEMSEDRIGTRKAYNNAITSVLKFKGNVRISDITVKFLSDFEAWLLENGRSVTTVGMYARAIRTVFNFLIAEGRINRLLYPFGAAKNRKYEIPSSRNIKKALTLKEIAAIYNYQDAVDSGPMCKDYWMFLYMGNGLNVKDFCNLKWGDINGDMISFIREKSKRTKKTQEAIQIVIQPEMRGIIEKYGTVRKNKTDYIFPHLKKRMSPKQQYDTVQLLIHLINEHMKSIAKALEIDKPVTTYSARHSFATILKNSGAPVAMISQALGHSSMATTQNYLASFETDQLKEATSALTAFK